MPTFFHGKNLVAALGKGNLFKWANAASFLLILFFKNTKFKKKTVGISWIRTRTDGVKDKHADHLPLPRPQVRKILVASGK